MGPSSISRSSSSAIDGSSADLEPGAAGDPLDMVFGDSMELAQLVESTSAPFDPDTESRLQTLRPDLEPIARQVLEQARELGLDARIANLGGARTHAGQEQAGRQTAIAARPGNSAHEFGAGFDVTLFYEGRPLVIGEPYALESYELLRGIARNTFGLDLGPAGDYGHFQLHEWRQLPDLESYRGPQR